MNKKVYAVSKYTMQRILQESKINDENVVKREKVSFISILNPGDDRIFKKNHKNVLTVSFWDVSVKNVENLSPITTKQAQEIVEFIMSRLKKTEMFLVHCSAGISRSGAVATFIMNLLQEMEYSRDRAEDFKKSNPQIIPNVYVKEILQKTYDGMYKPQGGDEIR